MPEIVRPIVPSGLDKDPPVVSVLKFVEEEKSSVTKKLPAEGFHARFQIVPGNDAIDAYAPVVLSIRPKLVLDIESDRELFDKT